MVLNILYTVLIIVAVVILAAYILTAGMRKEGARMYEKYSSYTRKVLAEKVSFRSFPVKPEYRVIHPWKALKLFKFTIDSNEADRFRRLNILDASMMLCMRMFTCFILPNYGYNLPMLSVDIIFIGKKRVFVIEVIDPAHIEDDNIKTYYDKMREGTKKAEVLEYAAVDMEWCNYIVTDFSVHTKSERSKDDVMFEIFKIFFNAYVDMAENAAPLTPEQSKKVQEGMEGYVNALMEKGGPAVNVFKFLLGPDKQQEYVRAVMFGVD